MSNSSRYLPKLGDREVIAAFESVAAKFQDKNPTLTITDQLGRLDSDAITLCKKLRGFSLQNAVLQIGTSNWIWERLRPEGGDAKSDRADKVTFSWNPHLPPERSLISSVSSELDSALSRPLATIAKEAEISQLASHSEILIAMESVAAKVLTDATEHRQALEQQFMQRENSLNARTDELRERELARIAEEKLRGEKDLSDRREALEEKQRSLESLQKQLDDRNNTHVRRDIRSGLLQLARERLDNFSVSRQTQQQYYAVHAVACLGLMATAGASVYFGTQISFDQTAMAYKPETIALLLKSAAFAATAIALGSWYLRWLNRWLQRMADAEFKLQQFRLDIDRASWLAETVLEWKSKSPEPFPELLTSRLSVGLFQSSATEIDDPKSPAHQIADALFGAASSVKLKVGQNEVNLDRRGIKSLGGD